MSFLTLTTDFGETDGYAGTLKGVIWGICPEAQIADISHHIAPQNLRAAALALLRAAPYFPAGTVHLAVVDPGVGTSRRAMAARIGSQFFVGPDNGLAGPLLEAAEARGESWQAVELNQEAYWLPQPSHSFHGRDIFAPVAAHLAQGLALEALGSALRDPLRLKLPKPEKTQEGWRGQLLHIDRFGNLSSNISTAGLQDPARARVRYKGRHIQGLLPAYGYGKSGQLIALSDSFGYLELALVNGNAARELGAELDEDIWLVTDA